MSPKPIAKTFQAVLERSGNALGWTIIRIPFDVAKVWGSRGQLRVKGEINATGTLTVGRPGHVEARLHASVVIVEGEVVGSIVATERIELREQARVSGDLETPALIIEESAVFEGQTKRVRAGGRGGEIAGDTRPVMTTEFATASS